jgi:hypothetical protein
MCGTSGRCPHCSEVVHIPAAEEEHPGDEDQQHEPMGPSGWLSGSVSGMVSLIFHLLVFLLLAFFGWETGRGGIGDEVIIGELPLKTLNKSDEPKLEDSEVKSKEKQPLDEVLETVSPADSASDPSFDTFSVDPMSPAGETGSFSIGAVTIGGPGGGGGWDGMLGQLRQHGLDVVLVFDSTGSMGGEIREVKRQISSIGNTLMTLVPKARISVCTYRDEGDEYVVKGLPLTNDLQEVHDFLRPIQASGGGDHPESVQMGLRWAVTNNQFRPKARKVILLFGDAPPHPQDRRECLDIASDFGSQYQGVVSTVTCRNRVKLAEFVEIAEVGGGESFLTTDYKQIITQLMVLVFGSKYRSKVIEAFRLMGD